MLTKFAYLTIIFCTISIMDVQTYFNVIAQESDLLSKPKISPIKLALFKEWESSWNRILGTNLPFSKEFTLPYHVGAVNPIPPEEMKPYQGHIRDKWLLARSVAWSERIFKPDYRPNLNSMDPVAFIERSASKMPSLLLYTWDKQDLKLSMWESDSGMLIKIQHTKDEGFPLKKSPIELRDKLYEVFYLDRDDSFLGVIQKEGLLLQVKKLVFPPVSEEQKAALLPIPDKLSPEVYTSFGKPLKQGKFASDWRDNFLVMFSQNAVYVNISKINTVVDQTSGSQPGAVLSRTSSLESDVESNPNWIKDGVYLKGSDRDKQLQAEELARQRTIKEAELAEEQKINAAIIRENPRRKLAPKAENPDSPPGFSKPIGVDE